MNFFPQLRTSAVTQYPGEATVSRRTVTNELADGRQVQWSDTDASEILWDCRFEDLDDQEWAALRALFQTVEGRLGSFTFFNPFENLMTWSGNFAQSVWTKGPLVALTAGLSDPLGGTSAWRVVNGSASAQRLEQVVGVPSTYLSCFSIWVRNASNGRIDLLRGAGGGAEVQTVPVGATWRRVSLVGSAGIAAETTSFGIYVAAGAQIEIFGAQLEIQPAPGQYKSSAGRGGVYADARFADDRLTGQAMGPSRIRTNVKVRARLGA